MKPNPFRDGVRKLGPGKFELCITYRDQNGKRKDTDRVFYCETRPEAIAERSRLQKELASQSQSWTVAQALEALYPTVRPSTRQSWKSWGRAISSAMGSRPLSAITSADVRKFLASLPISDASCKNVRTVLSQMFENAIKTGAETQNPVADVKPRVTRQSDEDALRELENPPRRAMLGDEIARFLAALDADVRPLITTQLLLGCRFGEASALQWADIDWGTGRVRLVRGQFRGQIGPNKKRRLRWGGLGPYGLELLRKHREAMEREQWPGWDVWCFPRPLTARLRDHDLWPASTAIKKVKEAQIRAGVDVVARTHSMRHTFVTSFAAQTTNAAESALMRSMVGHATEAQSRTYTDGRALSVHSLGSSMERILIDSVDGERYKEE